MLIRQPFSPGLEPAKSTALNWNLLPWPLAPGGQAIYSLLCNHKGSFSVFSCHQKNPCSRHQWRGLISLIDSQDPLLTNGWLMLGKAPSPSFWHSQLTTVTSVHTFNLNPPHMLWIPHKQSQCCQCHTNVIKFSWPHSFKVQINLTSPGNPFPNPCWAGSYCVIPLLSISRHTGRVY